MPTGKFYVCLDFEDMYVEIDGKDFHNSRIVFGGDIPGMPGGN